MPTNPNEAELLPCPYCGSTYVHAYSKQVKDNEVWLTACGDCHCDGPVGDGLNKESAIKAWNTRTPYPQPNIEAIALKPRPTEAEVERIVEEYSLRLVRSGDYSVNYWMKRAINEALALREKGKI